MPQPQRTSFPRAQVSHPVLHNAVHTISLSVAEMALGVVSLSLHTCMLMNTCHQDMSVVLHTLACALAKTQTRVTNPPPEYQSGRCAY